MYGAMPWGVLLALMCAAHVHVHVHVHVHLRVPQQDDQGVYRRASGGGVTGAEAPMALPVEQGGARGKVRGAAAGTGGYGTTLDEPLV